MSKNIVFVYGFFFLKKKIMDDLVCNDMTLILADVNVAVSIETYIAYDKTFILKEK
jgi:hypothetical protein